MTVLNEKLEEMARIKAELQRMEADDSVTEDESGDIRDTLVERWEQLDKECKPIIERMERIRGITRAADDPVNTEDGDGARRWDGRGPEFMQRHDPFEDMDKIRGGMLPRSDMIARSLNVVETRNRQHVLPDDYAQEATRKASGDHRIARHMLLHGTDDYYDAFVGYLQDPTGPGLQRAAGALALAVAQGGYMLPFVLDQLQVA